MPEIVIKNPYHVWLLDDVVVDINDVTKAKFEPTISKVTLEREDKPTIVIEEIDIVLYNILLNLVDGDDISYEIVE